jgi:hypothetical protein
MGFGAMFLGFMLLFDFQSALRVPGSQEVYAILDLFPDPLGWLLLLIGLNTLSKKDGRFLFLKKCTYVFLPLSLMTFSKDMFLTSWFYSPDGRTQCFAGIMIEAAEHIMVLGFCYFLFRELSDFSFRNGEDKLSRFHALVPRLAVTRGLFFSVTLVAQFFTMTGTVAQTFTVISLLSYLFWVCLIWVGTIALVRSLIRLSDL